MNTNWSTPKTNMLAGMNDLRRALAAGTSHLTGGCTSEVDTSKKRASNG